MIVNKNDLLEFISKYSLNGRFESVKLEYDDELKKLHTSFKSQDKSILGSVSLKSFDMGNDTIELGINDTLKLTAMLNIFKSDDVDVSLKLANGNATHLQIMDSKNTTKAHYNLADVSIIPPAGVIKKNPEFDFNIKLNFIDQFNGAFRALKSETFMIENDSLQGECKMVLSEDSDPMSNFKGSQVVINLDLVDELDKDITDLYFPTDTFKSILSANISPELTKAEFKISSQGIMKLCFESPKFDSVYYVVAKTIGTN